MGRRLGTYMVAAAIGTFAAGHAWAQTTTAGQTQDPQVTSQPQGRDEAASRQALVQARETLAEVTKMPEASQLQGEARTEVSQLINNFNSLLAAEANWYEHYRTVMQNVYNIIGPPTSDEPASATSGTTGSTSGTTGTTGSTTGAGSTTASGEIPSAIRNKLSQFRQHLMEFGRLAGAPDPTGGVTGATTSSSTAGTSGSTTTGSTTSGTTGTTTGSTTGSTTSGAAGAPSETVQEHVDAINDILQQAMGGSSTTGTSGTTGTTGSTTGTMSGTASAMGSVTLTREQVDKIQSHLQRIREISRQQQPVR